MRPPDSSPGRLPAEWLEAIRAAQDRAIPDRPSPVDSTPGIALPDQEAYGHSEELQSLVGRLKHERIRQGLSLADIARMTQQARSAISKLENGRYSNPTLNTLYRYAGALGWHIRLSTEPLTDARAAGDAS